MKIRVWNCCCTFAEYSENILVENLGTSSNGNDALINAIFGTVPDVLCLQPGVVSLLQSNTLYLPKVNLYTKIKY